VSQPVQYKVKRSSIGGYPISWDAIEIESGQSSTTSTPLESSNAFDNNNNRNIRAALGADSGTPSAPSDLSKAFDNNNHRNIRAASLEIDSNLTDSKCTGQGWNCRRKRGSVADLTEVEHFKSPSQMQCGPVPRMLERRFSFDSSSDSNRNTILARLGLLPEYLRSSSIESVDRCQSPLTEDRWSASKQRVAEGILRNGNGK